MRLLITGGTGTAGAAVVREAAERGHEVVVLSRKPAGAVEGGITRLRGDLLDPGSLTEALTGVEGVIDCANVVTLSGRKARQFFEAEVHNVLAAGAAAGLRRYVLLSIVGIDAFPFPYYAAKLAQERVLEETATAAGIGYAIVRTTQFHDFAAQSLARASVGPIAFVPAMHAQPVDVTEVAAHLLDVAESDSTGQAPPLSGPLPETVTDMARKLIARRGSRQRVIALPLPPATARANKARALIPRGGERGRITFADWLDRQATP